MCNSMEPTHKEGHIKRGSSTTPSPGRRAARFVLQNYHHSESVSNIIQLQWDTLERRRNISCLILLYNMQHGLVAINPGKLLTQMIQSNTQYHPNKFKLIPSRTQLYQNAFFPRTVTAWNALPDNILASSTVQGSTIFIRPLRAKSGFFTRTFCKYTRTTSLHFHPTSSTMGSL